MRPLSERRKGAFVCAIFLALVERERDAEEGFLEVVNIDFE